MFNKRIKKRSNKKIVSTQASKKNFVNRLSFHLRNISFSLKLWTIGISYLLLGFILNLVSASLEHASTQSFVVMPTLASTLSIIAIGLIVSSIVMIGFTAISPFLAEKFSKDLKNADMESAANDESSEIIHEYFSEIFNLNRKMEQEQIEIEQIKSETSQIAYETQEILSVLRSKVGMN